MRKYIVLRQGQSPAQPDKEFRYLFRDDGAAFLLRRHMHRDALLAAAQDDAFDIMAFVSPPTILRRWPGLDRSAGGAVK